MPRVYQPTRRERFAYFRKQYAAFIVAGLLGVALFAGTVVFGLWHLAAMGRDTAGSPLLSGQATVVQVFVGRGSTTSLFGPYNVELTFQGQVFWTGAPVPFSPGQRVNLHYRVGKSGSIYPIYASP